MQGGGTVSAGSRKELGVVGTAAEGVEQLRTCGPWGARRYPVKAISASWWLW